MTVLLLFFCSGATALIYEVLWSKHLALLLGSTVQAQTVVLAVFMGGLALGNRSFGRRADTAANPLALYGKLELAIGLYAFFFPLLHRVADHLFIRAGAPLLDRPTALLALKAALSVGLLLGPTILMGGTLPLIAAWLSRRGADAGRLSARFYSVNSLGAVCGAWLAGFVLVQAMGMTASLQLTALVNMALGLTALGLARQPQSTSPPIPVEVVAAPAATARITNYSSLSLALVALTGAVSMGLEVLAARSLVLIFGASLQAFAIVLMAFILGIGLGGAVMAAPRTRGWKSETVMMTLLISAALWIGLLVAGADQWVEFYRWVKTGLARTETGYTFHQCFSGAMSLVVLGGPAGLLGAVLPLGIRELPPSTSELGRGVGRLLTWNTIGAVAGTLVTGFVLMPGLGLRGAFLTLALGLCLAAWLLARQLRRSGPELAAGTVAAALMLTAAFGGEPWRHLLSSGVFRLRETELRKNLVAHRQQHVKIHFYEDAADASVAVEQGDGVETSDQLMLRINGKPDATSRGDLATQFLLGHLPMLARPESQDIFVLGFGSGVTAGALLGHPVKQIVVAENCAPVLRAAKLFAPWNRGVFTNRLARIVNEDARTLLKLSPQRYDIIISEPSNPWMVGVGSVFSREFYELCASRLKDGGIMTQWFHVYEMHDGIAALVFHTFASVFPNMEIWDPGTGDLILLGSQKPWTTGPAVWQKVFARTEPQRDLTRIGLRAPEALWARQFSSQGTTRLFIENGPEQSDEFPVLEYEAPRAFFIGASATAFLQFDERTRQHQLAPEAKRTALAHLSAPLLTPIFPAFGSMNPEATQAASARANSLTNGYAPTPAPSIFTPPRSDMEYQLLVIGVELSLRKQDAAASEQTMGEVAEAIRECITHGEFARARSLLGTSGGKLRNAAELRFLGRVWEQASAAAKP